MSSEPPPKKYEEYAHVIGYSVRAKSQTVKGREGMMVIAIGQERLSLLEILAEENSTFEVGEKLYIGKNERPKVKSVLGKIPYDRLAETAKNEVPDVIRAIVLGNEKKFIDYINKAQALTPRIHALELIHGIGKVYTKTIIEEREKKEFESFADIEERTGIKDLAQLVMDRIEEEIGGSERINLFVKR